MPVGKRKCPQCKSYNAPEDGVLIRNSLYCNMDCAVLKAKQGIPKGRAIKAKAEKKEHSKKKKAFYQSDLKTRKAAAKYWCHRYIKLRDQHEKTCICCDRPLVGSIDSGHWLESGNNPVIRYHEDNIHSQLTYCNNYQGGDSGDYEKNLRAKIGDERVDYLKSQKGKSIKRTAQDYIEIENHYKAKCKELENQ